MKRVLYRGQETELDPETFEPLDGEFARDQERVLHRGELVVGVDPARVFCKGDYVWDQERVYFRGRYVAPPMIQRRDEPIGADAATFEVLDGFAHAFAHDVSHLYWNGVKLDLPRTAKPRSDAIVEVAPDTYVRIGHEGHLIQRVLRIVHYLNIALVS